MTTPPSPASRAFVGLGLALTALALILRLSALGERPLHIDESALLMHAMGGETYSLDPAIPVWGTRFWTWLRGDTSNFTLRFLPAVLGALALWPFLLAFRTAIGAPQALLGGLFYAVSPFAVRQAAGARPYGYFLAAIALLWLAHGFALRRNDWRGWTAYGAAVALTCLSHLNGTFLVAGLWLPGLLRAPSRWDRGRLLAQGIASAAGCLPAALWAAGRSEIVGKVLATRPVLSAAQYADLHANTFLGTYSRGFLPGAGWLLLPLVLYGFRSLYRENRERAVELLSVAVISIVVTYAFLGGKGRWNLAAMRYVVPVTFPVFLFLAQGALRFPVRLLGAASGLGAAVLFLTASIAFIRDDRSAIRSSFETVTRRWVRRHSPDGFLVQGDLAIRKAHSVVRFLPPGTPVYYRDGRRKLFVEGKKRTGPLGVGTRLDRGEAFEAREGTYVVLAMKPGPSDRLCRESLPGSELVAEGNKSALCRLRYAGGTTSRS